MNPGPGNHGPGPQSAGPPGPRHLPPPPPGPAGPPPHGMGAPPHGYPAAPPPKKRGKGCLYAVVGGVAALFLMVSCGALVSSGSDPASTSSEAGGSAGGSDSGSGSGGEKESEKKESEKEKVTNGIGREYRDGKFAFTVTKVKKGVERVGNQYAGTEAQGQFVLVHISVENIGDEARMFTGANQTLIDAEGREFQADTEAAIYSNQETKSFLEQINPGNSVKGVVIFDVPKDVKLKAIELHDSMFSGGVTVPLGGR